MSLTLTIRPLALLGISDYFTRAKLSAQKEAYGALLGRIEGRELIIENAFELKVDFNEMRFDPAFCEAKLEQFKTVFPNYELLGWFGQREGKQPASKHVSLNLSLLPFTESPYLLLLDPQIVNASEVVLDFYETTIRKEGEYELVPLPDYRIEMVEDERIAIESTNRESEGGESDLIAHLTTQLNAVVQLRGSLTTMIDQLENGGQQSRQLLRQASVIACRLPLATSGEFNTEYSSTVSEVLASGLLGTVLKGSMELQAANTKLSMIHHNRLGQMPGDVFSRRRLRHYESKP